MANFLFSYTRSRVLLLLSLLFLATVSVAQPTAPVLSNLEAWYRNDGTITTTLPYGGGTNNEIYQLTNMNSTVKNATQPYSITNAPISVTNVINGKAVARFDGNDDFMVAQSTSGLSTLAKKTVFVVFKTPASFDSGVCHSLLKFGTETSGWFVYLFNNQVYLSVYNSSTPGVVNTTLSPNTTYALTMVFNSDAQILEGYLNGSFFGSLSGSSVTSVVGAASYSLAIGGFLNNAKLHDNTTIISGVQSYINGVANTVQHNASYNGDIAEVLHYNNFILTTQDRKLTEEYLINKYGLTRAYNCVGCLESKNESVLWLKADDITNVVQSSGNVSQWKDVSGNNLPVLTSSGTQYPVYTSNLINGTRGALNFSGSSGNRYSLAVSKTHMLNAKDQLYTGRSLYFVVKPNSDITTRQVLYKEGDNINGLIVYILNGSVYTFIYNNSTSGALISATIPAGVPTAARVLSLLIDGTSARLFFDGTQQANGYAALTVTPPLRYSTTSTISIGSADEANTRFSTTDLLASGTTYFPYKGYIAEVAVMDKKNSDVEQTIIQNHLALKYGVIISTDLYRWQNTQTYDLGGIGNQGNIIAGTYNTKSCSSILTFSEQLPGDQKVALIAHDNATIANTYVGYNSNTENSPLNVKRVMRTWRADVLTYPSTFGASKEMIYTIKISQFPISVGFAQSPVLILDKDGDFRKDARVYVLQNDGQGNYVADHIITDAGDNISIGMLNMYEFSTVGSPLYPNNTIGVIGKSTRGFSSSSLTTSPLSVSSPSSLDDTDYLIMGMNTSALTLSSSSVPYAGSMMMAKRWKANEFGDVGNVEVQFDVTQISGYTLPSTHDYVLMIDRTGTGTFSSSSIMTAFVLNGGQYRVFNQDFKDGDIITVAAVPRATTTVQSLTGTLKESLTQFTNHTTLTLNGTDLSNYTISTPCGKTTDKATVYLTLNTGDDYLFGETTFTTDVTVSVTSVTGSPSFSDVHVLTINNDKPEQIYALDVTEFYNANPNKKLAIQVTTFTSPANTTIKNSFVLNAELRLDQRTVVSTTPGTLINLQQTDMINVNKACKFTWGIQYCKPVSYQFQLLRLYNTALFDGTTYVNDPAEKNMYNAALDWSKALTLESVDNSFTLTLAEGTGYYIWRVRPIGNYYPGGIANNLNWGSWSSDRLALGNTITIVDGPGNLDAYQGAVFYYDQFDKDKNFIYSRSFADGLKIKEEISYANGLDQTTQNQTILKSNEPTGKVLVSETVYDFSGRPTIQSMAAPIETTVDDAYLGYREKALTTTTAGVDKKYNAFNFDTDIKYLSSDPLGNSMINMYYTNNADQQIPDANNYPYARVLYDNDGLNRIKQQGGVGSMHQIAATSPKTARVSYGGVTDAELIHVFGDEAPDKNKVFKVLNTDPNNVTTVNYIDDAGRVIATSLIKNGTENTALLPLAAANETLNFVEYINNNIPFGDNGIEATKPLVFTETTLLKVTLDVTPSLIKSDCGSYCGTCSYKASIIITNIETNDVYTKDIDVTGAVPVTCPDPYVPGQASGALQTDNIAVTLDPGKYTIKKTIVLNETKATDFATSVTNSIKAQLDAFVTNEITAYLVPPATPTVPQIVPFIQRMNDLLTGAASMATLWPGLTLKVESRGDAANVYTPYVSGVPGSGLQDGDKITVSSTCCSVTIPIMFPDVDPCQAYINIPTPDYYNFAKTLINKYKTAIGITDLTTVITLTHPNLGTYTETDFMYLLQNMMQETTLDGSGNTVPLYPCDKIWTCWNAQVVQAGNLSSGLITPNSSIPTTDQPSWYHPATSPINTTPNPMEQFLLCTGRHLKGYLKSQTGTIGETLRRFGYKLFYYNRMPLSAGKSACENYFCKPQPGDPAVTPCTVVTCTATEFTGSTYFNLKFLNTSGVNTDLTEQENEQLSQCLAAQQMDNPNITNQPTATDYRATAMANKLKYETSCMAACDSKKSGFIAKMKKMYLQPDGITYKNELGTVVSLDEITCTADRMVAYSKTQCYLSPQQVLCPGDTDPKLLTLGTPAEQYIVSAITFGDFDLEDAANTAQACLNTDFKPAEICSASAGIYRMANASNTDANNLFSAVPVTSGSYVADRNGIASKALSGAYAIAVGDNTRGITNTVTVSAWVKKATSNPTGTIENRIVSKLDGSGNGFNLYTKGDRLYFDVKVSGTTYSSGASLDVIPVSPNWTFVTGVCRDTTVEVWINGEYSQSLTLPWASRISTVGTLGNTGLLTIGASSNTFDGVIDEVYLTSCALEKGSIKARYNDTKLTDYVYVPASTVCSPGVPYCSGIPTYVENNGYIPGSVVMMGGIEYQCKPYPYSQWCNGAYWAYQPGSGSYWTDAWIEVGPCPAATPATNFAKFCVKWKPASSLVIDGPTEVPPPSQVTTIVQTTTETINQQLSECSATAITAMLAEYKAKCQGNIIESVKAEYSMTNGHFTLFYYDRAGNLVKTVPPEGVDFVPVASTNTNELARQVHPNHKVVTTYKYNSLGQIIEKKSPDEGTTGENGITNYIYNKIGLVRFSQDMQQAATGKFSYVKYDALGRIIETGQSNVANFSALDSPDFLEDNSALGTTSYNHTSYPLVTEQEIFLVYTEPALHLNYLGKTQRYIQDRLSYTFSKSALGEKTITSYSYDPYGHVEWVIQDIPGFSRNTIGYSYDIIDSKINQVVYNESRKDQFYHRYKYDADNRITDVLTSSDGISWDNDARYKYYKHGSLKREEIGEDKIQGLDYTYTIHGWLKAVNAPSTSIANDPGQDNQSVNKYTADRYGYVLGYYSGDFSHNGSQFNSTYDLPSSKDLYNGNIKTTTNRISELSEQVYGQAFQYDFVNRLRNSTYYNSSFGASTGKYNTSYGYDGNGNLTSLIRNGSDVDINSPLVMDNLQYNYTKTSGRLERNQLVSVNDQASSTGYNNDLEGLNNFGYDLNGNLNSNLSVSGANESNDIVWNIYGKVTEVKQKVHAQVVGKNEIRFVYDASGARIAKEINKQPYTVGGAYQRLPEQLETTYYVRDANGDLRSTYLRKNVPVSGSPNYYEAVYTLQQVSLYGRSRLGVQNENDESVEIGRKVFHKNDLDNIQLDFSFVDKKTSNYNLLTSSSSVDQFTAGSTYRIASVKLHNVQFGNTSLIGASALQNMDAIPGIQGSDVSVAETDNGQILFYTASFKKYWNKTNVLLLFDADGKLMLNSGGINASADSRSVVLRVPGETDKYFLITRGVDGKMYSHTIDMKLKGNGIGVALKGDVLSKNNLMATEATYGSHMIALENYATGNSYIYATRYTAPVGNAGMGSIDVVVFDVNVKGPTIIKAPVVMCTTLAAFRDLGESELQISPDNKKLVLYNHLKTVGWFGLQQSEVQIFNLGANYRVTSNYLVDRVVLPAGITMSGQSADFAPDNRFLYYGADRLTLTGSTPTDKEIFLYDIRDASHTLFQKTYNGNLRRGRDGFVYVNDKGTTSMPGYTQTPVDNTTQSNVSLSYFSTVNKLSGVFPLQNNRIIRETIPAIVFSRRVGKKYYELDDHLENVMVVVSDRKDPVWSGSTLTDNIAKVWSYTAYYPFGFSMPDRSSSLRPYAFGFNGQEKVEEIASGHITAEFWEYDSRVGRRWNVDPILNPAHSGYSCFNNNPIYYADPDGLYATKRKAEKMRQRALRRGRKVGEVENLGDDRGYGFFEHGTEDSENPDEVTVTSKFHHRGRFFGTTLENIEDGLSDLNPFDDVETYVVFQVKISKKRKVKIPGMKEAEVKGVLPIGIQGNVSLKKEGKWSKVGWGQSYLSGKQGKNEIRLQADIHDIGGDYTGSVRYLRTVTEKKLTIRKIPIGTVKVQAEGSVPININALDGAKIGGRASYETPAYSTWGVDFTGEVVGGLRVILKTPEIFKE